MKKFMKRLTIALAFVMCFSVALPVFAQNKVFAGISPYWYADGLVVEGFNATGTKGVAYIIKNATLKSDATAKADVSVKDPLGRTVTITESTFTPDMAGLYTVTYKITKNEIDFTTDMVVKVEGIAKGYEITFAENDSVVLPSIINPTDGDNGMAIVLPTANIVDKEGNEIGGVASTNIKITTTPATIQDYTPTVTTQEIGGKTYAKFVMAKGVNATYQIRFEHKDASNNVLAYTTKTIKADTTYANDYSFSYNYNTTLPTTAEIGVETKLPAVTGINSTTKDEVNVYYDVQAELFGTSTIYKATDETNDVITFKDGAFYFTPVVDGDYDIRYTVKNSFGKTATVDSNIITIKGVKDTTKTTPLVVLPYTTNENGQIVGEYTDATTLLPNNTANKNIILFPIYADDNANASVANNLTLKRIIKNSQGKTLFDESTAFTTSVANKVLLFNKAENYNADASIKVYVDGVEKTITKDQIQVVSDSTLPNGTLTIQYITNDKAGNGYNTPYTYYMTVADSTPADGKVPTITFAENLPTAIMLDQEVTFAVPTAKDDNDSRLSVYLTYQLKTDTWQNEVRADAENSILKYNKDTNKYSFTLTEAANSDVTEIIIAAYSRNAYGVSNTGTTTETQLGNVTVAPALDKVGTAEDERTYQVVKVLSSGDAQATSAEALASYPSDDILKQGTEITIPSVKLTDDLVDYLDIDIKIVNGTTEFEAFDAKFEKVDSTHVIVKDAHFSATLEGKYIVSITSTDAGNNKTVTFFAINVEESVENMNIQFSGLPTEINGGTLENGEQITLTIPEVTIPTDKLEVLGSYNIAVTGPVGGYTLTANNFFTANKPGKYTLQYQATIVYAEDYDGHSAGDLYTGGNIVDGILSSKVYKLEVVDTKGPEFIDFETAIASKLDGKSFAKNSSDIVVPVPEFNASDIDLEKSTIAVTNNDTIYLNALSGLNTLRFTKDQSYTVTYTLVDIYGNKTVKSVTFDVGNCTTPELEISDDFAKAEYNTGDVITIDLSKITVLDPVTGKAIIVKDAETGKWSINTENTNTSLAITLKNTTTGNTITNNKTSSETSTADLQYEFTVTDAGEYTFTITVTGSNNKVTTNTDFTFTVSAEDNTGATAEEILGYVLIVVSVLLLGGVIAYFVISKKNLEKKYK